MPLVCNKDATCVISEWRVRQRRRNFSTVATYNLPFSKKQACLYYCIMHNINDRQHYQLNAFLLKTIVKIIPPCHASYGQFIH